jgi:hypothetical protein
MIQTLVLSSILLTLPAQAGERRSSMLGGKPAAKPDTAQSPAKAPAAKAAAAEKPARSPSPKEAAATPSGEALAQYNALREKTPHTVAAQSKLAAWCEEHGLKAEAYVHYAEVVRLDPRREAAWRKLGYKKHGNRWMTEAQIAEVEEQKRADRVWAPEVKKIHKDIHGSHGARKRDQAQAALDAIVDPNAIPSLYREFAGRSQTDQLILIQVLGQIDKPLSTEVLALMSVFGRAPEVRRRAAENLRGRPVGDYLELLVGLMIDPLKYEVKPVGGPGSPGVLFVEGQQFNIARFYVPPTPNLAVMPGAGRSQVLNQSRTIQSRTKQGAVVTDTMTVREAVATYSMADFIMEQRKAAAVAETQLEGDLSVIKAINAERRRFNDTVIAVVSSATGKDLGTSPKDWRAAVAGKNSRNASAEPSVKPTFSEMIPVMYNPVILPHLSFATITTSNSYVDT